MRNPFFQDIRACVFDAYGTLFDYASAASRFGEQEIRLELQCQADGLGFADIVKLKRWIDVRWSFDGYALLEIIGKPLDFPLP